MTTPGPDEQQQPSAEEAANTEAMLRELATTVAWLPQAARAEGDEPPEGSVALPVIEQEGKKYIPVFTSEAALQQVGGNVGNAVRLPVAQLASNWPSEDMWLAVNPASEDGLALPPDVVRALPVFASGQEGESGPA